MRRPLRWVGYHPRMFAWLRAKFSSAPSSPKSKAASAGWLGLALATGLSAGACDFGGLNVPDVAGAAAGCPKGGSISAAMNHDWAGAFGLDVKAAGKIRAGVVGALELDRFAKRLDADLKVACGNMAKDLGKGADFDSGSDACKAASAGLSELRGQLGGDFSIKIETSPPSCAASIDAYGECIAECDADIQPGSVDLECKGGELVGKCSAECTGTCYIEGQASCNGTCHGSCSANFSGSCGGDCTGKCDGKDMQGGYCEGTCEGSCSAGGDGSCGGECGGSCDIQGSASCNGDCQGSCSVDFQAPKCTGEVVPPKASVDCKASCEAKVSADIQCKPGTVNVRTTGGLNKEAIAKYRAVLTVHLPAVLNVAVGLKDEAVRAAANVKVVVEGAQQVVVTVKNSAAETAARLSACVTAPFAAAVKAATSIQASVSVSVDVSVSASASGSASGSAGGAAG